LTNDLNAKKGRNVSNGRNLKEKNKHVCEEFRRKPFDFSSQQAAAPVPKKRTAFRKADSKRFID
jgi:hypothetical protein